MDKSPTAKPPASAGSVIGAIGALQYAVEQLPVLKDRGLGLSAWLFLSNVRRTPSARAGGIARKLGLTPQRATQIVKALKAAGLLDATANGGDPRKKDLVLTAAGEKAVAEIEADIDARLASVTANRPKLLDSMQRLLAMATRALAPAKKA